MTSTIAPKTIEVLSQRSHSKTIQLSVHHWLRFLTAIECILGLTRSDPSVSCASELFIPYFRILPLQDNHLGMKGTASKHGLAHGSFAWAARLHPKVRQVFADLYDAEQQDCCGGKLEVIWRTTKQRDFQNSNAN